MKDILDYSLLAHNTFGIDVKCSRFFEYRTVAELQEFIREYNANGRKERLLHIGGGSNLLFLKNFDGIVLHSKMFGYDILEDSPSRILVRVGSGIVFDDFVAHAVGEGWYGAENLSLIPGEVGASAVQNIGAYGVEAKDIIEEVNVVSLEDGSYHTFSNSDCCYGYRDSMFKHEWKGKYAVVSVVYRLKQTFVPNLEYGNIASAIPDDGRELTAIRLRRAIIEIRKNKLPDPSVTGNAGSFFMNPVVERDVFENLKTQYPDIPSYLQPNGKVKIPAGWMIDKCGWKGKSLGKAGVYEKQALVLVNNGGATGEDIVALSNAVCQSVKEKFGIEIRPEVNFI